MTHSDTIPAVPPIYDGSKLLPEILALRDQYPTTPLVKLIDIYVNEWADNRMELVADQLEALLKERGRKATLGNIPVRGVVKQD